MSSVILWEKPKIGGNFTLKVGDNFNNVFGYQLVMRGVKNPVSATYYGECKVKVFPRKVFLGGTEYTFNYDPIKSTAVTLFSNLSAVEVKWKEANLKFSVLSEEELTEDSIFSKCICKVEEYINKEYLPEIFYLIATANG